MSYYPTYNKANQHDMFLGPIISLVCFTVRPVEDRGASAPSDMFPQIKCGTKRSSKEKSNKPKCLKTYLQAVVDRDHKILALELQLA